MQLPEAVSFIQNGYLQSLKTPTVWADLGCGSGLFTKALSHYLKQGSTIYAVDKSSFYKPEIKDSSIQIISLKADFEREILPVGKLDGILMANSLHYVKDKKAFLLSCKKHYHNETFLIIEYDTNNPVPRWVPYPVSFSAMKELFASVGFNHIDKIGERPSVFGNKKMYAALVLQQDKTL